MKVKMSHYFIDNLSTKVKNKFKDPWSPNKRNLKEESIIDEYLHQDIKVEDTSSKMGVCNFTNESSKFSLTCNNSKSKVM